MLFSSPDFLLLTPCRAPHAPSIVQRIMDTSSIKKEFVFRSSPFPLCLASFTQDIKEPQVMSIEEISIEINEPWHCRQGALEGCAGTIEETRSSAAGSSRDNLQCQGRRLSAATQR